MTMVLKLWSHLKIAYTASELTWEQVSSRPSPIVTALLARVISAPRNPGTILIKNYFALLVLSKVGNLTSIPTVKPQTQRALALDFSKEQQI